MLYFNRKVLSRKIFALHKFIKGLVHNLQKTIMCTHVQRYVFIQTIFKVKVNLGMRNIEMNKMFPNFSQSFSWLYKFILLAHMKAIPHLNIMEQVLSRDIDSIRVGCCPNQYSTYPHLPPLSILSGWNHVAVPTRVRMAVLC